MFFKELLQYFLIQLIYTLGSILFFGFLISACQKAFYRNLGTMSLTACYVTGFIGTPIHECSHALFCIIFGHKIVDMQLFQIGASDGAIGYVEHSYNPKNIYQRIGTFFIGTAPILVISALLYLLAYLLIPELLFGIIGQVESIGDKLGAKELFSVVIYIFKALWEHIRMGKFWIFLLVGIFLALHMSLSGADIKNAAGGLGILLLVLFVTDAVLHLFGVLDSFTVLVIKGASFMITFLSVSLVISFVAVLFSLLIRWIARKF